MKLHICVLTLFLLFVYVANGKNVIGVVNSDALFKSENTIYLLKKKIDLKGKKVNIPKGCELKNGGGSITNGTLVGNETVLSGEKRGFIDCRLYGSFEKADIESFIHKNNKDLARIRNLVVNSDCEVEVEETDEQSFIQTIQGNNHTITLKWIKNFEGEHAAFNVSGQLSLSNIKIKVERALVNKQSHRPSIFKTTISGYDISFSNIEYSGNILFHKIYLDAKNFSNRPSFIKYDNVKLQTDNTTDEYFLIEYIDRSNFFKPKAYDGEITFKNCSFTTNSDNAYAPVSIQMPYKLSYERCLFQRNSQRKVCSLETIVPEVSFKECTLTNVGFVDNISYANYIKCQSIRIVKCNISQPVPFEEINTRMRVLGYSSIDIEDSHFLMNGSKFGIDAFNQLTIKNCQYDITKESPFNQGFVVYQEIPNNLNKNKKPYILIDNISFNKMMKDNNAICLLEFDESSDGVNLHRNLKIDNLRVSGFDGRQYVLFKGKTVMKKLFLGEKIKSLDFNRNHWKKF